MAGEAGTGVLTDTYHVLRVDTPQGVDVPGGSYVTVESGPHEGLQKAYGFLNETSPAEVYARGSAVGDIPRMLVSTSTLESAQQSRKRVSRQLGFTGQLGRQRSASSHSTEQDPDSHEAAQTKGRHRRNCRGLIGPDYAYYVVQLLPNAPRSPDNNPCVALESGPHVDLVSARRQANEYTGAASTNLVRLPEKVVQWPVLGSPDRQVVRVFITTHSKYTPTRYRPSPSQEYRGNYVADAHKANRPHARHSSQLPTPSFNPSRHSQDRLASQSSCNPQRPEHQQLQQLQDSQCQQSQQYSRTGGKGCSEQQMAEGRHSVNQPSPGQEGFNPLWRRGSCKGTGVSHSPSKRQSWHADSEDGQECVKLSRNRGAEAQEPQSGARLIAQRALQCHGNNRNSSSGSDAMSNLVAAAALQSSQSYKELCNVVHEPEAEDECSQGTRSTDARTCIDTVPTSNWTRPSLRQQLLASGGDDEPETDPEADKKQAPAAVPVDDVVQPSVCTQTGRKAKQPMQMVWLQGISGAAHQQNGSNTDHTLASGRSHPEHELPAGAAGSQEPCQLHVSNDMRHVDTANSSTLAKLVTAAGSLCSTTLGTHASSPAAAQQISSSGLTATDALQQMALQPSPRQMLLLLSKNASVPRISSAASRQAAAGGLVSTAAHQAACASPMRGTKRSRSHEDADHLLQPT